MNNDTMWWVECGANIPKGGFTRNHIMPVNKVTSFRMKWDNKGVFATAYMYDSKEQSDANLYGDFYLDFDYDIADSKDQEQAFGVIRKDVIEALRYLKVIYTINQEDVRIYFSGSKGIHLVVSKEIIGVVPHKHLNMAYRMMAEDISKFTHSNTLDLKIYDNKRLFRLPHSIHPKTELYKIPLTYEELTTLKYQDIVLMAQSPRAEAKTQPIINQKANMQYRNYLKKLDAILNKPKSTGPTMKLDYTPPCVDYLLHNEIGKGQRNDSLAFLASFCKQSGYLEDETDKLLVKWGDDMCTPSIPEEEVTTTVNSIYKGDGKMGCSTATILSKCDKKLCKLHKRGF